MNGFCSRFLAVPLVSALIALAACNGTAVVTMTSTASQDHFLAYRVGLVSVQLESSSGSAGLKILPTSTTVDLAGLTDVSEVLGAAAVSKGSYKSSLITLDYSAAQIVYDNGSLNGVALTPVGANGQALGLVKLTVKLDPDASFDVSSKGASQLALDFNLAASNAVNLNAKTVTVTPLIAGSAAPIDNKQVRVRGPLVGVAVGGLSATAGSAFTMGVMPFNGAVRGTGNLSVIPSDSTTFEINGVESTGSVGLGQLASLGAGALTVAYGTLTTTDQTSTTTTPTITTPTDTTTPTDATTPTDTALTTTSITTSTISFTATQILAGSSVQGGGSDRVTGIVSARSGDTLTIEDGTLVANDGTESFLGGTTFVIMGPNTVVTVFGQSIVEINSPQQVSVGSAIDAFGVASVQSVGNATLDASAGRVRLDPVIASGLVTVQGSETLNLNLAFLGGRSIAPFDFVGTGADARQYIVSTANAGTTITTGNVATTGPLDLSNATVGAPVIVTGLPNSFGAAPPNFTASALLDPTTIAAELVVDWGAGTAAPFTTYDTSAIDVDLRNAGIGTRHQIAIGAQNINILGLSSNPQIVPNSTASATVYSIGHTQSATIENFNTYDAFITQLQTELKGSTLATELTAVGQYTPGNFSFAATSITLSLND